MQRPLLFTFFFLFSFHIYAQKTSNDYYSEYNKAVESGQIRLAIDISEQWKKEFHTIPEPFYRSGKALSKKGRRTEAIISLKEALQRDSTHVPSLLFLAELIKQSDNKQALKIYDDLVILNPENAYFYREAAECAVNSQSFEKAIAYYSLAYELDSLDLITINGFAKLFIDFKQYNDADILLDQALSIDSLNSFALLTKARLSYAREDWVATLDYLEPVLRKNPPKTAYRYQGIALYQLARYEESIEVLRMLANIVPDLDYPHYYMGLSMEKLGQNEMATVQFQQAVNKALSKNLGTYYERLGLSYQENKDHEKAIENITMAMKFSSRNIMNYHLARSYDVYYQDQSIALKTFQKFIEQEGEGQSDERTYAENRVEQMKKDRHFQGD
ncbi:MAG: tetratricopeptide repeat protein [Bacteroidota bacterium]